MRQAYGIKQSEAENPDLHAALAHNVREVLDVLRNNVISATHAAKLLKALAEEVLSVDGQETIPSIPADERKSRAYIIAEETLIPDGEYRALWTGAVLDVYIPGKETCIKIKTNISVKGVDMPIKVIADQGTVFKLE